MARRLSVLSLVALLAAACSVDSPEPSIVAPEHAASAKTSANGGKGSIEVKTATTGADLDPDGYTVTLNGGSAKQIGVNSTVTYSRLSAGEYQVALSGVASNCTVAGENPRMVSVSANSTSRTTFEVSCTALAPAEPAVLLAAGDIGVCGATAPFQTADIIANYPSATVAAVGDLAYPDGREQDFRDCYHPSWGAHKDRTRPALGNHEYNTGSAQAYFDYFGPVAGDPSKGYYSYTLGEWFVVVLNVNPFLLSRVSVKSGSEQERWLRQQLSANPKRCTLAYFHYPRFSSGHHGSQSFVQDIWSTLYDYGVDVVVAAHEHSYERFAKMDKSGAADPVRGIRQFVVGTGGVGLRYFNEPLPTSEVRNSDTHGVLRLSLEGDAYQWEFLPVEGKTFTDTGSTTCH